MKTVRVWPALVLALAACGTTQDQLAASACHKAIAERLSGKTWDVTEAELRAGFKPTEPGAASIVAPVYFDRGLPAQTQQVVTCRVQFDSPDAAAEPSVVGLVFQW